MSKWICNSFDCNCGCKVENNDCGMIPCRCPHTSINTPFWVKVEEAVTESNQLPKLTAEVFGRPGCPEWAKYAAVDSCGDAYFYAERPQANSMTWGDSVLCEFHYIGKFDATDWQNSLLERPAKKPELPDWCKVGEWVWLDPKKIHGSVGYEKIKNINGLELRFKSGTGVYFSQKIKQARLRPYTADEMRGLVGKVIENQNFAHFITTFDKELQEVVSGSDSYSAKDLVEFRYTIDGQPCGVLEHMEEGEWVK